MNEHSQHVEAALRATVFASPTSYSWFGKGSPELPRWFRRALTPETARGYLLATLQSQLYRDLYCPGSATAAREEVGRYRAMDMSPFVGQLSAANAGKGCWENDWEVRSVDQEEVVVHRAGLELRVRPDDCSIPDHGPLIPGQRLSLRFSKELLRMSPGFYLVLGDRQLGEDNRQSLVRVYWHLIPEGAVPLVRLVSSMLNAAGLPFRLKLVNEPTGFKRCDAAVLYTLKSDYAAIAECLRTIYPQVATWLRPQVPVFTKRLAPGVGLAENPVQGESFGLHRCQLLADGMIRAYEAGRKSIAERLQVVADRFREEGISLEQPFLNPSSCDDYDCELVVQLHPPTYTDLRPAAATGANGAEFLALADRIGQHMLQEAVWHGDRCTWLGVEATRQGHGDSWGITYKNLGPDLYAGTSGVALFLAQLYAVTGDARLRLTANGAMRQALCRLEAGRSGNRLGFYTGWAGIAYAAARVSALLSEESLLGSAVELLQRCSRDDHDKHDFDIISGRAGAIAALMVLREMLGEDWLLDFAIRMGDELLHTAKESGTACSWPAPSLHYRKDLTGFSHGTAGVAYALLELFHATRDTKYRRAAELAFNYERRWFNASADNWPDFREEPGARKRGNGPWPCMTAWCHGAPGIGLSRLRAYEVLRDGTCKDEALIALETTRSSIKSALRFGTGSFCLCHGLAGNAELLLQGSLVLGEAGEEGRALALEVGNFGLQKYDQQGLPWPCGIAGAGETPSLMLGLAGIGYFYLRLHNPLIASILLLRREDYLPSPSGGSLSSSKPAGFVRGSAGTGY